MRFNPEHPASFVRPSTSKSGGKDNKLEQKSFVEVAQALEIKESCDEEPARRLAELGSGTP